MRVALYSYRLAPPNPTGVHRYAAEISRALHALHPDRYRLVSSAESARPAWVPAGMPAGSLPGPRRLLHLAWRYLGRPAIDRWTGGADLLHVLIPTFPVPARMPVVTTIHDLMPLQHPEWFPRSETWLFRAALDRVVDRSARIVAVSGTVAKALTEEAGVDPSRIVVVHEGISDTFFRRPTDDVVARTCERYGVDPGGYLIFVGAVSARKNIVTLLEAIARRGPGARLLVAGSMAFGSEAVKAAIERLGLAGTVATPGSVPDADLAALLAGAVALVHPSEYEGFGLTPLEAMAIGTPAIASRAGALPEVVGEAGILVEPRSVDEWTEAIARIERDADLVAQLSERGRAHAAGFTWRRAAEQTAAVHEAVAATKA